MFNLTLSLLIAVLLAVLLGNGSVVLFNHIPQQWFEDWYDANQEDKDPHKRVIPQTLLEADNAGRQRLASSPWKYLFVGLFGIVGVYLAISSSPQYEFVTLLVLFVCLEMAIADQLYRIVPDQLQFLLALSSLGFIGYYDEWWEPLAGAGIGLLISLSVFGLGMLLFRTGSIGGADIKFYTCMGLVVGRSGIVVIFILTTLFFAIQAAIKIATGRGTIKDSNAMLPAAFVASLVYLVFLSNIIDVILF